MSFSPAWVIFTILGIGLAVWMTSIQWRARGGHRGDLWAIAVVGLPAAVIGGRLGHLISASDTYFGPDGSPLRALALWDGGFSFWGASILGFFAVWLLTRFQGIRFRPLLDSAAPGLILGHVAGAFSDWFDGRLELVMVVTESAWNLIACVVLIIVSKRLRLGYGQVFALYLCLFGLGRVLLEALRIGTPAAEDARLLLGLPLNLWTAILALLIGLGWLIVSRLRHRTYETGVYMHGSRTLLRRHRRGKHTFEINAPNIAEAAENSGAPLPSVARVADPDAQDGPRTAAPSDPASATAAADADESERDDESGLDLSGRHSFGFFGAVTSAISIVPDVRGKAGPAPRDESTRSSES
ncbi:Prolipoprotein diacylglyceryltransferase [Brevibacterium siliguriense]|uniref:Prolipoprotein diacylglyceryltransferase n=1 Tax=Brevibacterium siliguriense TaxID=1136497 RepID=A0A1H1TXU6_9MICO|nr:prolipoprotein diacylglyceryl transferase family protein [Brevibacterium siliguriense]SDS65075.1 Prolipoprotein diacylglyceryltransferase [Brevibacterium siliguriense]